MRITLLWCLVGLLAIYAWKDWYKSLCGLILLMAVIEHPDMPKSLMGIQGLNPWNILLGIITLAWFANRRREELSWDMPSHPNLLLLLYLAVIAIGFYRMAAGVETVYKVDMGRYVPETLSDQLSEYIVNCIKWVVPGLLLFDGCRSRSRLMWGFCSVLGIYIFLALQVIRWMPLEAAMGGDSLGAKSLRIMQNEIGYHRVNLSMMLAGASWAIFSARSLANSNGKILGIIGLSMMVVFGQALTGGRAGYATWAAVGLVLCLIRWRRYLLIAPFAVFVIFATLPGVSERFTQGFTSSSHDTNPRLKNSPYYQGNQEGEVDLYTVTAGRNIAWPYVIEKVRENPLIGYGREAMQRTGIALFLWEEFGELFPHPHNAYLQLVLDNGVFGAFPVFLFFLIVVKYSVTLFRDSRSPEFIAVGGVTLSLVLALLVASIGSQSFYPREGSVGMWCAIGLMLRVYVQRAKTSQNTPDKNFADALWVR